MRSITESSESSRCSAMITVLNAVQLRSSGFAAGVDLVEARSQLVDMRVRPAHQVLATIDREPDNAPVVVIMSQDVV